MSEIFDYYAKQQRNKENEREEVDGFIDKRNRMRRYLFIVGRGFFKI